MAEEDLAPGKSSVAVNNCIRQLSYCKNDIRDTVGIWGEVSAARSSPIAGGVTFLRGSRNPVLRGVHCACRLFPVEARPCEEEFLRDKWQAH